MTPPESATASYLQILEHVLSPDDTSAGFELVGAKMAWLSLAQATALRRRAEATPSERELSCSALAQGPCLVLALQRSNAISRLRGLISGSAFAEFRPHLLVASSSRKAAAAHLTFFFACLEGALDSIIAN